MKAIGFTAVIASVLYFVSDLVEVVQGRFSDWQLVLTLIAETAIPVFVVGFALVQRPRSLGHPGRLGHLGDFSALAYAYAYLYFTGTVVYALANGTENYQALTERLGSVMTIHGAVMVVAGVGFGYAVLRDRLFPRWTAVAVMVGVVLVAAAQGLPDGVQLVAAGVRDLGFAGMGVALLRPVHLTQVDDDPWLDLSDRAALCGTAVREDSRSG
ncbi:MAG: hypothetical protein ABI862_01345 [Ilumatobacteraceae bacterium]